MSTTPFITDQSWGEHEAAVAQITGRIGQIVQIVDGGGADVQADSWDAVPVAAPAAPLAMGASTEGHLDSTLQQQLDALFAAAPGDVSITSGFRTRAEQEALYAKYKAGGNLAAVPGTSRHETGRAADLHYASPEVQQWVHEHAAEYGLVFPINGEPWHVELAGGRNAAAPTSAAPAASAGGMVSGDFHDRMAQIMGIVNGSGADPQTGQWSDMTAASTPTSPALEPSTGTSGAVRTYPAAKGDKAAYQSYAQSKLADHGWDDKEMPYLIDLWNRESGWNPNAQNPTSTAYGIAQFLDTTWENYGTKTSDPYGQIDAGLAYVKERYGSPSKAIEWWDKNGWY